MTYGWGPRVSTLHFPMTSVHFSVSLVQKEKTFKGKNTVFLDAVLPQPDAPPGFQPRLYCIPAPFPDTDVPSALRHLENLQGEQRSCGGSGNTIQDSSLLEAEKLPDSAERVLTLACL